MIRSKWLSWATLISIAPFVASGPAAAAQTVLGQSGAWRSIAAEQGGRRVCFVVSEPTARLPVGLRRDPASFFVTLKSGRGDGSTEVSINLGFPLATAGNVAEIDGRSFALMARGETAWLASESDEPEMLRALRDGRDLRVTARSTRGNTTNDAYGLSGFTAALTELQRRCRP